MSSLPRANTQTPNESRRGSVLSFTPTAVASLSPEHQPKKVSLTSSPFVFLVAIFASLGGLVFGFNQGVIANVLVSQNFAAHFPDVYSSPSTKGWVVSLLELGAFSGSLVSGILSNKYGRRQTIVIATIIFLLGASLQTGAPAHQGSYLMAGRFVGGIGVGILAMVVPAFQSEVAPVALRGMLVSLQQFSIALGICIAFWLGFGSSKIGGDTCKNVDFSLPLVPCEGFDTMVSPPVCASRIGCDGQSQLAWRLPLAIQLVPAIILGAGVRLLPESPRWLMMQQRPQEVLNVLARLRRLPINDPEVLLEAKQLEVSITAELESEAQRFPHLMDGSIKSTLKLSTARYLDLFKRKPWLHRLALASGVVAFQQLGGVNAIVYFSPTIIASIGFSTNQASLITGILGTFNVLATIPSVLKADAWGRKPILLAGSSIMCAALLVVMSLNIAYQDSWAQHRSAGFGAIAGIFVFLGGFSFSWGPMGWLVPTDLTPEIIASEMLAITTSINWILNFAVGKATPVLIAHIRWGTYLLFAVFLFLSIIFVYYFLPETANRSVRELDIIFGDNSGQETEARIRRLNAELGLSPDGKSLRSDTIQKGSASTVNLGTISEKNMKLEA